MEQKYNVSTNKIDFNGVFDDNRNVKHQIHRNIHLLQTNIQHAESALVEASDAGGASISLTQKKKTQICKVTRRWMQAEFEHGANSLRLQAEVKSAKEAVQEWQRKLQYRDADIRKMLAEAHVAKEEIRKSDSELHLAKVALKEEQEINKGVCHRFYNDFVESSPPPFCPKLKTFNGNEKFNQKLCKKAL